MALFQSQMVQFQSLMLISSSDFELDINWTMMTTIQHFKSMSIQFLWPNRPAYSPVKLSFLLKRQFFNFPCCQFPDHNVLWMNWECRRIATNQFVLSIFDLAHACHVLFGWWCQPSPLFKKINSPALAHFFGWLFNVFSHWLHHFFYINLKRFNCTKKYFFFHCQLFSNLEKVIVKK